MDTNSTNSDPFDFSKLSELGTPAVREQLQKINAPGTVIDYGKIFAEMRAKEEKESKERAERFAASFKAQSEQPSRYVHPNDPCLDLPMFNRNIDPSKLKWEKDMYIQIPKRVKTPYELHMEEVNRQMGQSYLNNRGYRVEYNFPNRRNLEWIGRYQRDINNQVNSPDYIAKQYWPNENVETYTNGFIPVDFTTEEDKADDYYNMELRNNQAMAESEAKQQKAYGFTPQDDAKIRVMTPYEKKAREKSIVTPSINPQFLKTMESTPFTYDETSSLYNQQMQVYDQQREAFLKGREMAMKAKREKHLAPQSVGFDLSNPDDWDRYKQFCDNADQQYSQKRYQPGRGYLNTAGNQDQDGLPTRWFFDNWLYLTPTQEEIEDGEVVGIKMYRGGKLIGGNNVERKPLKEEKKSENEEVVVRIIRTKTKEDGSKEIDIYDGTHGRHLTKEEVHEYFNEQSNENSHQYTDDYKFAAIGMSSTPKEFQQPVFQNFSPYTSMVKSAQEQMQEDDTLKLANELSRYNQFVADNFMWFSTMLPPRAFASLKQICQSQLLAYRDADPFRDIKQFVFFVGDKIVVTTPKPTTLEEIDKLSKEVNYDVSGLKECETLEDKVKYLQSYKNAHVIPDDKDDAYAYIQKKLIPKLNETQLCNKSNYHIYKRVWRSTDDDPLTFEERFYKWWMSPRQKMTEKEYRQKYVARMTELATQHMMEITERAVPYVVDLDRRIKAHNDFLIRLTNGKIVNSKTIEDANEVTSAIIEYGRKLEARRKARSSVTNVDCTPFRQALAARMADCVNFGGLDRGAAMVWNNPATPEYGPIQINPTDPPEVRAQEYIKKIFRKKKGGFDRGY